ncbi:porin [Celeribacter halophilus]|uniref:porin n=1 Tax=Celeribacter halophilus TaxID=576117 RepID=UPI003A9192CC
MKNILLSSAAIALLAGAASAEVTWSGDAEIGYNDDYHDGTYYDVGLTIGMSQELNNGWTVSGSLDVDLTNGVDITDLDESSAYGQGVVETSDWVLTLSNDMFTLSFGDVDTAYASFSGVSDLYDNDLFAPNDEAADYGDSSAGVLVSAEYGQFEAAVSFVVEDDGEGEDATDGLGAVDTADGDLDNAQVYLGADFGMMTAGVFYDDALGGDDDASLTALTLGGSFGGADITFSVANVDDGTDDETGYGIEVSYPVGPVTLGAYYGSYDAGGDDDMYGVSVDYADGPITVAAYYEEVFGEEEYGIEGIYDFGMGLVVTAGYVDGDDIDDDDFAGYVVAEYDLGGGASFLASYVDYTSYTGAATDDMDTVGGGYELFAGATMALSFEF